MHQQQQGEKSDEDEAANAPQNEKRPLPAPDQGQGTLAAEMISTTLPAGPPSTGSGVHGDEGAVASTLPRPVTPSTDLSAQLAIWQLGNEASAMTSSGSAAGADALPDAPFISVRRKQPPRRLQQEPNKSTFDALPADKDVHGEEGINEDCTICWSAAACMVFQPCGHLCCCAACAQPMLSSGVLCPICRGSVAAGIDLSCQLSG